MTRWLSIFGWLFVAIDLIVAAGIYLGRAGGDAATRGLGQGMGMALAALTAVAALLLWFGRAPERALVLVLGSVLAAAPLVLGVALTVSRQGLGLIFASLRQPDRPLQPVPRYAFPDAAGREAALALVMNDYAKLDSLLRATPRPDLTARDERGVSLLGMATRQAVADGGSMRDLEGLRLLLAAGTKPRPDDLGPDYSLIEYVASDRSDREPMALELLLKAGLSPDTPLFDGKPVLFHARLAPEAARLLLAHGVDRMARDNSGGRLDWSSVTYQADLRRWATALVLLEGGVPRDHGTPPGSVLARVLKNGEAYATDAERAYPAYQAFMEAVRDAPR